MKIEDTKPKLKVTRTKGVFQSSSVTWSDPTVQWSDASQKWAGGDILAGIGVTPTMTTAKAHITFVTKSRGVFDDSTDTYNSLSVTYSDAIKLYGGSDRFNVYGPTNMKYVDDRPR